MRPLDHFFSRLVKLEQSPGLVPEGGAADHLGREFSRLLAPVIGAQAAEDLCYRTLERLRDKKPTDLQKLGNIAAFFLDEYDPIMELEEADWIEIQQTLEDASEEMNIETLTGLMGNLLSKHRLK